MAVTRLDITAREPLLGGKPFGATGAYEVLRGTVTFAVDPVHPRHHDITDLDKAPRTCRWQGGVVGRLHYTAAGEPSARESTSVLRGSEPGAHPGVSHV